MEENDECFKGFAERAEEVVMGYVRQGSWAETEASRAYLSRLDPQKPLFENFGGKCPSSTSALLDSILMQSAMCRCTRQCAVSSFSQSCHITAQDSMMQSPDQAIP